MGMVPKMNLDIRQIHRLFVGEVSGIDLRRPPDAATVAAIDRAMDQYAVLVFRGQSSRPLYVTAAGLTAAEAAVTVGEMAGRHRVPDALKLADRLARGLELSDTDSAS